MSERFTYTIRIVGEWDWERSARCIVCNLPIKKGDKTLKCPYCKNYAHEDHILEWIKIKGKCPFCGRKLERNDLQI